MLSQPDRALPQQMLASLREGIDLPELQLTPIQTSTEPDVVIIQDDHVASPEESPAEFGQVGDMPKAPPKSEDALLSTPPTEQQDSFIPAVSQPEVSPAGTPDEITLHVC